MNIYIENINKYSENFYKDVYLKLNNYQKNKISKKVDSDSKKRSLLALHLVSKHLNIDVKSISYRKNIPYVKGFYFSISHSDELVCVAFSNAKIGVDIEKIKPVDKSVYNFYKENDLTTLFIKHTMIESNIKCFSLNVSNFDLDKGYYKVIIINKSYVLCICSCQIL